MKAEAEVEGRYRSEERAGEERSLRAGRWSDCEDGESCVGASPRLHGHQPGQGAQVGAGWGCGGVQDYKSTSVYTKVQNKGILN